MCVFCFAGLFIYCGFAVLIVGGVGDGVLVTFCRSHFTFVCFVVLLFFGNYNE